MTVKRLMLVWVMILCLFIVYTAAFAESAQRSSFDLEDAWWAGKGFVPGSVLYLPDFTGTGCHWETLAVQGEVRVTVTPVALSRPADAPDAVYTYEVQLEGVEEEDAFIHLELCKDGVPSWRCNLYVIVDPSLDVKIQSFELMPAYGNTSHVQIDYGTSDHFTREEMDAAIAVILHDFSTPHEPGQEDSLSGWAGFTLYQITYVSDACSQQQFEYYGQEFLFRGNHGYRDSLGRPYVDGIYFQTSFHTMMMDDGWSGFESGSGYGGYGWTLLLTEDGEWEIITTGY